jgi:hypothetical protein
MEAVYLSQPIVSPKNDATSIIGDARWIPSHLNRDRTEIQFVWLPRETQATMSFLADQYLRDAAAPEAWLKLEEVRAGAATRPNTAHYIFHSAFCCSTLLARAVDLPGTAIGLREPQIVNELAALMRARSLTGEMLQSIAGLLARPFGPDESVIIKPSNEANILAEPLLQLNEQAKAVLLYAPLRRFLGSVQRKGMWGRIWGRRLFALLRRDPGPDFGFTDAQLFEQTDLQVSAMAWLLQHYQFAGLATRYPGRVAMLDSETLLARRADCLAQVGKHLGLRLDAAGWARVADSDIFAQHSKEIGRAFTPEKESTDSPTSIDEEIGMVCTWAEAVASQVGLTLEPSPAARIQP